MQVRLDGFVLLVEKREIRNKIFHDVHCSARVLCRVGEVGEEGALEGKCATGWGATYYVGVGKS